MGVSLYLGGEGAEKEKNVYDSLFLIRHENNQKNNLFKCSILTGIRKKNQPTKQTTLPPPKKIKRKHSNHHCSTGAIKSWMPLWICFSKEQCPCGSSEAWKALFSAGVTDLALLLMFKYFFATQENDSLRRLMGIWSFWEMDQKWQPHASLLSNFYHHLKFEHCIIRIYIESLWETIYFVLNMSQIKEDAHIFQEGRWVVQTILRFLTAAFVLYVFYLNQCHELMDAILWKCKQSLCPFNCGWKFWDAEFQAGASCSIFFSEYLNTEENNGNSFYYFFIVRQWLPFLNFYCDTYL